MKIFELSAKNTIFSEKHQIPWPLKAYESNQNPTFFYFETTSQGFILHIEAFFTKPLMYKKRPPKGRVFETDCLELFLRPALTTNSKESAPYYYGWEIAPDGCLLDYRAGVGEEGRRCIGSGSGAGPFDGSGAQEGIEPVRGLLHDTIEDCLISFDYDWKSQARLSSRIVESKNKWLLDLEIPWLDFGLTQSPRSETWTFTVNRIDVSSQPNSNPGLACLHQNIQVPRFHQPALFCPLYIC